MVIGFQEQVKRRHKRSQVTREKGGTCCCCGSVRANEILKDVIITSTSMALVEALDLAQPVVAAVLAGGHGQPRRDLGSR